MLFFALSSCTKTKDLINNTTTQTANEIKEKLTFYVDRLHSIADQPEPLDKSIIKLLSTEENPESIRYNRDELPPEYPFTYNPDVVDPQFVLTTSLLLSEFISIISQTPDFQEDHFSTVAFEDYFVKYKSVSEENQIYIEAYRYDTYLVDYDKASFVSAEVIFMDLVDNKMNFKYVRDNYEQFSGQNTHIRYYDMFVETGDMLNIMVNMKDTSFVSYQKHTREDDSLFLFTHSDEGLGFNYKDTTNDQFYSIFFNPMHELMQSFICYGTYNPKLSYSYYPENPQMIGIIKWNLLYVDGWDQVLVNMHDNDQIFIGDDEVLSDFNTEVSVDNYTDAETYLMIYDDSLTETIINLSDYGLFFDEVSLSQLLIDRSFLVNNYEDILVDHGFSIDMTTNGEILLDLIPFWGDERIIKSLL